MRVEGSGFRIWGLECRVYGLRLRVEGSELRVEVSGFRVQGSGISTRILKWEEVDPSAPGEKWAASEGIGSNLKEFYQAANAKIWL